MFETLKKIGVPTALATIIVVAVMMVPFMFKIDERYAKHSDVKETIEKLRTENTELRRELAQLVGFQQAMATLIQAGKIAMPHPTAFESDSELSTFMIKVQAVVKAPEKAASAPATPASAASAPPRVLRPAPKKELERPTTWKELNDGLYRQQQRLKD
jgi:hypothetical protein